MTQTDNNNSRDSNDTRRTILVIALLVLGVLVLLLAVPDRGPVVIDAETGGLAIVTDDTVDLVAHAVTPRDAEPGIEIYGGLAYVSFDSTWVDYGIATVDNDPDSLLINNLQHLKLMGRCVTQFDPVGDALRLTVIGVGNADCAVEALLWNTSEESAPIAYKATSRPTAATPSWVEFVARAPVEFREIPISNSSFSGSQEGRVPRNLLISGTARFPSAGNRVEQLYSKDQLALSDFAGIVDVRQHSTLEVTLRGTAGRVRINNQRASPSSLESLLHTEMVMVAGAAIAGLLSVVAGLRNLFRK